MSLKHRKVVTAADAANAAMLRPSDWGSTSTDYGTAPTHVFDGGALGALAMRDTGSADGFSWVPSIAGVLVSDGADEIPVFRPLLAADIPQLAYSSLSGLPTLGDAAALDVGTGAGTVAAGDHLHAGVYEPAFATLAWSRVDSTPTTLAGYGIALPLVFTKDADGPMATFTNGDRSNYLLFSRTGFAPKVAFGALGSIEANVSYNMDYANGSVHAFYDSTQNANWAALNSTGLYIQFAPSGAGGPGVDIWNASGSQYLFTAPYNANAVISNGLTVGANIVRDKDGNSVGGTGNLLVGTANDGLHWRTYILGGTGAASGDLLVENSIGAIVGGKRTTATATATANLCGILGYNGLTEVARLQMLSGGATDSGDIILKTRVAGGSLAEVFRVTSTGKTIVNVGNLLVGSSTDPGWRTYVLGGSGAANGDLLVENAIGAIMGGRRTTSSAVADTNLFSIQAQNAGTEVARFQAVSGGATDSGAIIFRVKATGVGIAEAVRITSVGNVGVGLSTFGTSAAKVLGIGNGTEPSTSPADMVQIYSVDLSAGNATLGLRTETAVATESVVSDRTLSVRINGTTYKLCLKA